MGVEIERKFLLKNNDWRQGVDQGVRYEQGYFVTNSLCSVRVRTEGESANITIKSAGLDIQRSEYEYPIPISDAQNFLENMCIDGTIQKIRYIIKYENNIWEIDEFSGKNKGLIVAEIELSSREQSFVKPSWVGQEVSGKAQYMNSNLVKFPFCDWDKNQ